MAERKAPSKGGKPDKLMRDAITLDLKREAVNADGQPTKRLNLVASKLVDEAIGGNVQAIKEINERMDGKVPQAVIGDNDEDAINIISTIRREIVRPDNKDG